jgi:hypothetical protein
MLCNWYYDFTEDGQYTNDDEGCLVQLCRKHARDPLAAGDIQWASRGDESTCCEHHGCTAHNNPEGRLS